MSQPALPPPIMRFWRVPRGAVQNGALVDPIIESAGRLRQRTDQQLRDQFRGLGWKAATGAPLVDLVPQAYPVLIESTRRSVGQSHYAVQVLAGVCLASGGVAEMQTGEGKTLTALLPAALYALAGRGVHVVTANDYLAGRDAGFARAALAPLGLSVGCVTSATEQADRRAEYDCDITYGSSREFGFDFLRDELDRDARGVTRDARNELSGNCVQRGRFFALVDEADNVLLDDACTPLLIAQQDPQNTPSEHALAWAQRLAKRLAEGEHFQKDIRKRLVKLTAQGLRELYKSAKPTCCARLDARELRRTLTNAIAAQSLFRRDRDYLVEPAGGIAIIDGSTGRLAEGRVWRDGMQQAVEAKEGLEPSPVTETIARCTVQSYFLRYQYLAGLTGTAYTARRELRQVYSLAVSKVPTHKPCLREELPSRVFSTHAAKLAAIVEELTERQASRGAVLVGVPSVRESEQLSRLLSRHRIEHQVLNCREHGREAEIVAQAGQPGRVTIATNMAGRGTDVRVHPDVLRQGGLHVLITQMHASARIDRQLEGRAARQGEPGSCQYFLSLEDSLISRGAPGVVRRAARLAKGRTELPSRAVRWFRAVQQRAEESQRNARRALLKSEQQRDKACRQMGLTPVLECLD